MLDEEEEGESFEFDDKAPEAERPPSFPAALDHDLTLQGFPVLEKVEADLPPPPPQTCPSAPLADFPPLPDEKASEDAPDKELPLPPEGADNEGKTVELLLLDTG